MLDPISITAIVSTVIGTVTGAIIAIIKACKTTPEPTNSLGLKKP
jgi:hypothetical protein